VSDSKEFRLYSFKELNNYFALEINLIQEDTTKYEHNFQPLAPPKGDLKYGFDRSNPNGGIHLHARTLVFIHPVTKETLSVTAPVPNEVIWNTLN
jgi:23S rRNA pseudouridine1911/1915/1917 synthase